MFLCNKRESIITNVVVYKPLDFPPFFDHSRCLACTTDILSSYTHTSVSVCQGFLSQQIHCNLCLDTVLQPSGTHLSRDSTQVLIQLLVTVFAIIISYIAIFMITTLG